MNKLSIRLETIASLVSFGARVCDIGTDHGYLSIHLKNSNIAKSVIATDLNEKPLLTAKKNIDLSGAKGIDLRLGNGLAPVKKGEADTVIIAGMGGEVISGILAECEWIKNDKITLILQPTTSADALRRYLSQNDFEIKGEKAVSEKRKLYSVMVVKYTGNITVKDEYFYYIGLLKPTSEAEISYIKKQQKILLNCISSLESIPSKQEDFIKYKNAYSGITQILTEYNNGI